MASSTSIPTGNGTTLPPFGNGQSRETAQWSYALAQNPTQPAYITEVTLAAPTKWRICTKAEAVYYQDSGHRVWRALDGRRVVFKRRSQHDLNAAFASQFGEIVDGERALANAGYRFYEVLDEGASDDGSAADEVFDGDFSVVGSLSADGPVAAGMPQTPRRSGGGVVGAAIVSKNK